MKLLPVFTTLVAGIVSVQGLAIDTPKRDVEDIQPRADLFQIGGVRVFTKTETRAVSGGDGTIMTVTVRMMGGLRLTWDLLNAFNADPAQHGPALASAFYQHFLGLYSPPTRWDSVLGGVMRNVQAIYKHTNDAGAVNNGVIGLQWTHLSGPFSNLVPAEKIVEFLVRYFSDNNGLSVIHEVVPDPFSVGGPVHQGPIKRTSLEAREEQCTIHDFVSLFNNGVLWFPDDPFYGVAC